MALTPEDYTPQKWFNSVFSELLNYELVQNPYEEGFLWNEATLKKRDGMYTETWAWGVYNWKTDATIKWKIVIWWVAFFWDEECKVYRFEKVSGNYIMTKVYDNTDSLSLFTTSAFWTRVKQKAVNISYVSWLVNSRTADKVLSTNDDWNGNVILAVNEAWTFDVFSTGKYIYFTDNASSNAKYQIRQIVEFVDDKTVHLGEMFYAEPSTWEVSESWETYDTIDKVVVFNNLRNSDWRVLCLDLTSNVKSFRNFWWNDIEFFEWRLRQISWYWTSVWWSMATWEYEILDPNTVLWSSTNLIWQKMDSLIPTKNYLLVNQENAMSVIRQIWSNNNIAPIYNFNSISSWESSYWPDSTFYKWWLYFLAKDRIFQGWDIVPTSTNLIELDVKNQGIIIERFLWRINQWDYVRCYDFGRGKIIQHNDWEKTYMLVYDAVYEWRLPREYNVVIEDRFEMFYNDLLIWVGDKICIKDWNNDLWEDIKVKLVITGSKQVKNSLLSLKKIKITLWYFWNAVKFKFRLDLWNQVFASKIEKDANWIEYLLRQNVWATPTTVWSLPLWANGLWGSNAVSDHIAKTWLIWIPIWKKCTYYKFTLENIDNFDLNIVSITSLIELWSPIITPSMNII